ncbi:MULTISPECIES: hypothetical protein [Pectobacterium]|uniref:hypothetical protein n=1 Tax=Pectobacterium TaxID=122277 RepID=UPI0005088086|nr:MULTISPECIES: hypothetical protein [Pectobacterium]KFX10493.1 hypothetical protein JV34_23170 [Pectobacterium atrosepticum]KMK87578.1 hypothetical protein KCQ_05041 [Pectobacterium atrosepticum ICMP 1526]QXE13016.1 hypothetical protein DCX48_00030 [Pectobacterium atrosepticum]
MTRQFRKSENALALVAAQNERLEQRVRELESQLANPPLLPNELNREAAFELLNTFPEGDVVDYVLLTWNECRTDAIRLSSSSESVRGNDQLTDNLVMMIKRLAYSLRRAKPDSKAAKEATAFLVENKLISVADCLRTSQAAAEPERILPILPVRDKDGCWRHPDRLTTPFDEIGGTDEQYAEWYGARGMETKFTYMNDAFCECCTSGDIAEFPALHWNPEPPSGSGWILTMIFDTEDGVCAEWIRYIDAGQDGNPRMPYDINN